MEGWALGCAESGSVLWVALLSLPRVDSSLDLSRQPCRETASFKGPVWTAPLQDTLPSGGGAVVKTEKPRTRPSLSNPSGNGELIE